MGNYKCEIMLKQYTPMVHFQHDEPGACLRASEVKPKLDKYVLTWLSRQKIKVTDLPANWSDRQDQHESIALRYKMRFSATRGEVLQQDHPLFFGNQGNSARRKSMVWNGIVNMTIVCLVDTKIQVALPGQAEKGCMLIEILKSLIPSFFETHCSGMRSNKGFGSFGVAAIDGGSDFCKGDLKQDLLPPECEQAYFMAYKQKTTDRLLLLDDVYILSSLMKGGVNRPYFKSQLHQAVHMSSRYEGTARDEARASEKAFIKQQVFRPFEKEKYNSICKEGHEAVQMPSVARYYYYRALLGLAGNYSFFGKDRLNPSNRVNIGPIKVVVEDKSERNLTMDKKGKKIGRFPNPVVFKPSPEGLMVLLKSIPEPLKTASFLFRQDNNRIMLPKFDLEQFVKDCLFSCVDESYAQRWTGWNDVKGATIYRRDTKYGSRIDNFTSVKPIVEKTAADEGRK